MTYVLGSLSSNVVVGKNDCKLNKRVEKINLANSDTNSEQKKQLIRLMNKYEMCFANNLMELGRTTKNSDW